MPSWYLDNADEIAAANKYTFEKPSRQHIAKLSPGDLVKLIFVNKEPGPEDPRSEKMWVQILEVSESGQFSGALDNDPYSISDLKWRDIVTFDASHIVSTDLEDEEEAARESLVERYFPRCFVTNYILNKDAKVGALYRETPEHPMDSGWRFLSNLETPEYMSISDNIQLVSLGAVLRCDDSFVDLLDNPPGSAFERNPETGEFEPAEFPQD